MGNWTMNGPTRHLTWQELACKDGTGYPQKFVEDGRIYRLAQVFENIRRCLDDAPIKIHSAYRTIDYNRKVGGKPNSYHIQGMALDIDHIVMGPKYVQEFIQLNWMKLGVRGLGMYKNFTHIDIRPDKHLITWIGS